jgi:surface polysaccharide O-acyltransferase-like enzyme
LLTVKPPPPQKEDKLHLRGKVIRVISQNTLGIFFIHVMIIESFQQGYFGITINRDILNPIIEAPLLTVIVLFVSLGIILILKRLPYLKKIIGAMDA